MTERITLDAFIKANAIRMTAERTDSNPSMSDSKDMDHWKVVLHAGRSRVTTYFSVGYGHNGKAPEAPDVLSCLADDAAGVTNAQSFEDWCSEYGYESDSRKAERIYKACEHSAAKLHKLLGDSAYETLLWNVERN